MNRQSGKVTSKHGKFINKRNYQYLGLLGISLFSLSLSQLKPVDAHADSTGEQTEVIADSSSQSSKPASEKVSNGESTSQSNLKDTSNGSGNGSNVTPGSSTENVQSNNSDENTGTGNVPKSKLPVSNTKALQRNILIKADAPASSAAVTPGDPTPSNLVVIKNGDSSVQLDNKLKLTVDQTSTLGKVTATNSDNFTYDEGTQTATITNPTASDAVTAEYKNVGTYQGKAISAQVTIANILKHTDEHPVPNSGLTADQIQLAFMPYFEGGIKTYNVGQDEVTIKFFNEAGNQVVINGDGYITVGSLNGPSTSTAGNEYINYGNGSTSTYVTEDSVVKYQTNPLTGSGKAYVGVTNDFKDALGAPTSENGAVTFQLSGNTFTFLSGTTRYTLKNADHHWSYTLTTFSSATVAPAVIPAPVLIVDKSSAKAGDTVNYTLDQQVNVLGEDTMLRYQSWSEVVTLPTEVNYQQASLLDSTGVVIPAATFTWNAKTHQLTVTLPEDYLQNTMDLDGETYQIKIGTTVNNGVSNGEVGPASGQVIIDNGSKASNGVSTVYVAPVVSVPTGKAAPVIVRYFSSKGILKKTITLTGNLGESYVTSVKKPKYESGYTVDQMRWPKNAQGVFSDAMTYVDYYYVAPIDSWKSYTDQTQVNTVVSGNKKLMDLNIYYPNGAKVSVTITKTNQVNVHTLSPNGYSTKMVTLTVGETYTVEDSDGSIHWIKLLSDGSIDLTYEYDHGKVNDRIDTKGSRLNHSFIKLVPISVNTISEKRSGEKYVKNISDGTHFSDGMEEENRKAAGVSQKDVIFMTDTKHNQRAAFSKEQNNNSLLPQTNEAKWISHSIWEFIGLLASLLGLGKIKKGREKDE